MFHVLILYHCEVISSIIIVHCSETRPLSMSESESDSDTTLDPVRKPFAKGPSSSVRNNKGKKPTRGRKCPVCQKGFNKASKMVVEGDTIFFVRTATQHQLHLHLPHHLELHQVFHLFQGQWQCHLLRHTLSSPRSPLPWPLSRQ